MNTASQTHPRYRVEANGLSLRFQRQYAVVDIHSLDQEGRPAAVFQTDDASRAEERCDQANQVSARRSTKAKGR